MSASPNLQISQLDPASLLLDRNIRSDADLDGDFLASIRDHGVLIPIVAMRAPDGIRVRYGARRTRAAIHVGRATVPVLVVGDDADGDAAEIDRVLTQWAENQHRAALSIKDQVHAVGQLAVFGLPPAKIARRLHTPRRHVDAALTVVGSPAARDALVEHGINLFQAVVIAEFADDLDAVAALMTAASTGGFDHTAQRLRDRHADQQARSRALDELRRRGVRIIDRPASTDPAHRLSLLDHDGVALTPEAHRRCLGHAAYLIQDYNITGSGPFQVAYLPEYVCTDPAAHGHSGRYAAPPTGAAHSNGVHPNSSTDHADGTDHERPTGDIRAAHGGSLPPAPDASARVGDAGGSAQVDGVHDRGSTPAGGDTARVEEPSDEEKARRQQVLDDTRAWQSATTVRRDWLRAFLARRTPPKGTSSFITEQLAAAPTELTWALSQHHPTARLLLGAPDDPLTPARLAELIAHAGEHRAQTLALALILGAFEETAAGVDRWQHPTPVLRLYLTQLARWGYTLADIEHRTANPPDQADQVAPDSPADRPDLR
ncbi:ParB N-terminal domain-containing protein [Parafrankia sp. FMc6]|uniref:ParB/RepB/Spo0J family partition protein n=1 Tax=Parafrankia soli TaxID=2599596 RepID=UPI0034D49470